MVTRASRSVAPCWGSGFAKRDDGACGRKASSRDLAQIGESDGVTGDHLHVRAE